MQHQFGNHYKIPIPDCEYSTGEQTEPVAIAYLNAHMYVHIHLTPAQPDENAFHYFFQCADGLFGNSLLKTDLDIVSKDVHEVLRAMKKLAV